MKSLGHFLPAVIGFAAMFAILIFAALEQNGIN